MRYAGGLLQLNGTDISKLTPYGKEGIAIKGELDYKGKTNSKMPRGLAFDT